MRVNLTKKTYEDALKGNCPICGNSNCIEENEDERTQKAYPDFCYGCNSPIRISKTYAQNAKEDHYQL